MIEKNQRLRNLKQLRREFGDACRQQRQKQGLEMHLWESMTDIPSSFINAIEEGRARKKAEPIPTLPSAIISLPAWIKN